MYNAYMTRFVLIPTYDTNKEFYMSKTFSNSEIHPILSCRGLLPQYFFPFSFTAARAAVNQRVAGGFADPH